MDRRTFCGLATASGVFLATSTLAKPLPRFETELRRIPAAVPGGLPYTTWAPAEITCPLSKTKNTFLVWGSYGSYIYLWPSKYQLLFWPYTESAVLYSCKKCRLTTFMDDFEKVSADKFSALTATLKDTHLPAKADYTEIPMSARLAVAEKVYRTLGQSSDEFWCHFYRVLGYHLDAEKKATEADEARQKALAIVTKQLADPKRDGRKELWYISAAMRHFLRDDAGALGDFEQVKTTKYAAAGVDEKGAQNAENYLNTLTDEYLELIRQKKYPRDGHKAEPHRGEG